MEMGCYRKILHILHRDHVTNEEVRAKIQQAIVPHGDLTVVKGRKLKWYGHVSRPSGLAKTILQGTMKGGRRQGRQRRDGKTTSGNGPAWSSPSHRGQWRKGKDGGNWLSSCKIICGALTTLAVKEWMMMNHEGLYRGCGIDWLHRDSYMPIHRNRTVAFSRHRLVTS